MEILFRQFRYVYWLLMIMLLAVSLEGCSLTPTVPSPQGIQARKDAFDRSRLFELRPSPSLTPAQVVKIQLDALRNNDSEDRGIATTFRFASPANKRFTGPLKRFGFMIKSSYSLMLDYERARYGDVEIVGNEAVQRVSLISKDGLVVVYKFTLSKQTNESCIGCWMTDSVIVEEIRRLDQSQI